MTIAMLVCDPPHVLVAADRRYTVRSKEDPSYLFHSEELNGQPYVKVRVHPTLPVVWTAAGLASLDGSLEQAVHELCHPQTYKRAGDYISSVVARSDSQRFEVLWGGLGSAVHFQFLGKRVWSFPIPYAAIIPPDDARPYLESLTDAQKYPPRGSNPNKIARHMRRLLGQAIEAARKAMGDEASIGGYIDVALAGPNGAQIFK